MNCSTSEFRPLGRFLVLTALVFAPACGDNLPTQIGEDVAAIGDVTNDLGNVTTDAIDDVGVADVVSGDVEKSDVGAVDIGAGDVGAGDVGAGDVGEGDATGDATGDASTDGSGGCPGAAGCACKEDADCATGGCLLGGDGKKACAAPCTADADCTGDDVCQDVSGVKLCVPGGAALCAPCVDNGACQYGSADGVCVAGGGEGNFCGTGCKTTTDCGKGYSCADVKDIDGKDAKQCVPENTAICTCSGYAIATAAKTTCFASGLPGCTSTRSCLADGTDGAPAGGGLAACAAQAPGTEICDGLDNNCDGSTDEESAKSCDDNNTCTADTCEGGKGCVNKKLDGVKCDDGSACTQGDTCAVGLCTGATVSCDDSNACTDDGCDLAAGCTHTNNISSCDDGNTCTKGDACAASLCAGVTITCDDSNPCTDDSCDLATGCTTTNNSSTCDDNSACTKDDACAASLCAGVTLDCDDGNACTTDSCDAKSGCLHAKLATGGCDDGTACTSNDACDAGVCKGAKLDCNDKNPCTDDVCDATSGCTNKANTQACDDGSACTEKDACSAGTCSGAKKACEDGNACTDDSCDAKKGCVFLNNSNPCDDGDACSVKDACAKGTCAGAAKSCDDGNACTADACDKTSGNCAFKAVVGKVCTDGNACTVKDACDKAGTCVGAKLVCEDGKPCTDDPCDPKKGCGPKIFTKKPCNDGSVCTTSDTCDGKGTCGGEAVVCDDNNPCTNDSCDPKKGCQKTNNTAKCDDGDSCTKGDVCGGGVCKPGNNSCQCQSDKDCPGADSNLCNGALVCKSNKCVVSPANVVVCKSDNNPCTIDACTPKTGKCDHKAVKDGATCDADGSKCTAGDSCKTGKCLAGKKLVCDDSKPCTADSCDAKTGCVNAVVKTGGVTLITFDSYPGNDGKLGTKDDKPAATGDAVTTQFASYGLSFGLVGGGSPRIYVSKTVAKSYAPNLLRPVDPKDKVTAGNYKDVWIKLAKPAMRVKIMVLDVNTKEASALLAYNAKGVLIGSAKHPGAPGGLIIPLEVKVDGSKGWIARVVVDLTNSTTSSAGPELYDNFEFEWLPGCSDGNICTEPDLCDRTKGACLAGAVKSCDDGNQCTKDSCDATLGCQHVGLDKVPCDDGNKCTAVDVCAKGACMSGKKTACNDGKPCTTDSCDPVKGCVYTVLKDGGKCTDGNACTTADACKAAKCVPGAALKCDDGDLCTLDSCDPKKGCKATAIVGCGVKPMPIPYVEPFGCASASGKLWTFSGKQKSPAWAIDATPATPAAYSPKCSLNFNDGKSYVCKGGLKSILGYATSPKIDLTKAKLPVLTFQLGGTWENGKFDDVKLQVSTNGTTFVTLANYDPAGGNKWAKKTVALSAYAGKIVTLRFLFSTADCYANGTSGAFVDDVHVADMACKSVADCNDANGCTVDVCAPLTGKCLYSSAKNGAKCEDGDLCTSNVCASGKCTTKSVLKCLADNNACTGPAVCQPKTGKCVSSYVETCNDSNPCTKDSCSTKTGGCTHQTLKVCKPTCKTGGDCFDNNPCTVDQCGKDGFCAWASVPVGKVCGDGKVCGKATQCTNLTTGWARNLAADAYGNHFCVTTATGGVACWGRNTDYQSGNGVTTSNQKTPHLLAGLKGIQDVETGRYHSCALSLKGEVWCWGRNTYGQVAPGVKATKIAVPQKVPGLLGVRKLALGWDFTCALHGDRTVSCWGSGSSGQLGHNSFSSQLAVKKVAGLTGVLDIAADYNHACVIRTDGGLYCTGSNSDKQTSELSGNRKVFTKRGGAKLLRMSHVMAGYRTTCMGAGSGWACVGASVFGAMGDGSTADAVTPVPVQLKAAVAQMAGGYYAHYALTTTGDVYGAGFDYYGSFGLGTTQTSRTKYIKTGFAKAVDVDGDYKAACVLTMKGAIYCAGSNIYNALGNGSGTSSSKPVWVAAPCAASSQCDDGNACTTDTCKAGACVHAPLTKGVCDDGNPCTISDSCTAGKCGGKPALCDDKNACTIGDACAVNKGGKAICVPGLATTCDDKDKCTADSCDKASGKCVFKPIMGCIQACKIDADCDDQNLCTQNKCLAGGCMKTNVNEGKLCDEAKICTTGQCAGSGKGWAAKITAETSGSHTCALGTDTKVYCWGSNGSFRAGQPSGSSVAKPTAVPGIKGATDVVAGYDHTCAKVAGAWLCWGGNTYGQLGTGATGAASAKPLAVTVVKDIVKLTAGYKHTCALRSDATVTCWGYGGGGRLGDGLTGYAGTPKGSTVKGLKGVADIWTSDAHSCATLKTGAVYCWGSNGQKRLVDSTTTIYYAPTKKSGASFGVAGGYGTVCWPGKAGSGWCTGDNDNGQLGNGALVNSAKPVKVVGPTAIAYVAGGGNHTTALTSAGKLWAAGDNYYGQLGIGSTTDSKKFVAVTIPGGQAVIQVRSGYSYTCALLLDGSVVCAGSGSSGKQGDGSSANDKTFTAAAGPCTSAKQCDDNNACTADSCVAGVCTFTNTTAACSDGKGCTTGDACSGGSCVGKAVPCDDKNPCTVGDACVESGGGLAKCVVGKLKVCNDGKACTADSCDTKTGACTYAALPNCVAGCKTPADCDDGNPCTANLCLAGKCLKKNANDGMVCGAAAVCGGGACAGTGKGWAATISAADYGEHFCALGTDGKAYCWGEGSFGRQGDGSTTDNLKPTVVAGLSNLSAVIACDSHSCALDKNGKASCWGRNSNGQLGNGVTTFSATSKPVAVTVAASFKQLACGDRYTCGILPNNSVVCWGYGYHGRLGSGSSSSANMPKGIAVKGLTGVAKLNGFDDHVCAIKADRTVWCWGENYDRPLQDTTTSIYYSPVQKKDAKGAGFIQGSTDDVCWGKGGKAFCAGSDYYGQLGDGKSADNGVGVQVVGPFGVASMAGGYAFNTVVGGDGSLWGVGQNTDGQLGLGSATNTHKWTRTKLGGALKIVQSATSSYSQCVLTAKGTVLCAGNAFSGRMGNGSSSTADQTTFALAAGPCIAASECNDDDVCTIDKCTAGSCVYSPNGGKKIVCNDGLGCTTNDVCSAGKCVGTPMACDDKNACTIGDACVEGKTGAPQCVAGKKLVCNDLNPCTADSCDKLSGACKFTAIPGCAVGCKSNADCNDNNPCTADICLTKSGSCALKPTGDGDICAAGALCAKGKCAPISKGWAKAITADSSGQHVCALRHDGTVACWGKNSDGQVGNGGKSSVRSPTVVAGLTKVKQIAAGGAHTCALRQDGKLYCWGRNSYGQCGNGVASYTDLVKPTLASKVPLLSAVWAGYGHTCGRTTTGALICWGYNSYGDLGDGTTSSHPLPSVVKGLPKTPIASVSISYRRACALTTTGDLYCWGHNYNRDVNPKATSTISVATKYPSVSGVAVFGGGSGTNCAMVPAQQAMMCWGDDLDGELGYGAKQSYTATPQKVKGLMAQPVLITGGDDHTLILSKKGQIYGAGDGFYYQLGLATNKDVLTVSASGFKGEYAAVVGAYNTTCALGVDGQVYCVGYNYYGTVGNKSTTSPIKTVTKVVMP